MTTFFHVSNFHGPQGSIYFLMSLSVFPGFPAKVFITLILHLQFCSWSSGFSGSRRWYTFAYRLIVLFSRFSISGRSTNASGTLHFLSGYLPQFGDCPVLVSNASLPKVFQYENEQPIHHCFFAYQPAASRMLQADGGGIRKYLPHLSLYVHSPLCQLSATL